MPEAYFDVALAVACVYYKTKTCVTYFETLLTDLFVTVITHLLDEICLLRL